MKYFHGEPELVHSQWLDKLRAAAHDDAEHRLLLAVFEQALRDYLAGPKYQVEILFWVAERNGPAPFSFEAICAAFALDVATTRRGLFQWMQRVDRGELVKRTGCGVSDIRLTSLNGMEKRPKTRGRYAPRRARV